MRKLRVTKSKNPKPVLKRKKPVPVADLDDDIGSVGPTSPLHEIPIRDNAEALQDIINRTQKLKDTTPDDDNIDNRRFRKWCDLEIAGHQYWLDRL